jgi:hypothetical protein
MTATAHYQAMIRHRCLRTPAQPAEPDDLPVMKQMPRPDDNPMRRLAALIARLGNDGKETK